MMFTPAAYLMRLCLLCLLFAGVCVLPVAAQATDDAASTMLQAMGNREASAVFEIGSDFQFRDVAGSFTRNADGVTATDKMTDEQAQDLLRSHFQGLLLRMQGGEVTIDNVGYSCALEKNDVKVKIEIDRGNMASTLKSHLTGTVHRNKLTASVEGSTLSVVNKISVGYMVSGDISVTITALPKEAWPPMPPTSVAVSEVKDKSIVLTWDDPNADGKVSEYDIYRLSGFKGKFAKVATVTGNHAYMDSSDTAKLEIDRLLYYVVARGANKKESCPSAMPNLVELLTERYMRTIRR